MEGTRRRVYLPPLRRCLRTCGVCLHGRPSTRPKLNYDTLRKRVPRGAHARPTHTSPEVDAVGASSLHRLVRPVPPRSPHRYNAYNIGVIRVQYNVDMTRGRDGGDDPFVISLGSSVRPRTERLFSGCARSGVVSAGHGRSHRRTDITASCCANIARTYSRTNGNVRVARDTVLFVCPRVNVQKF